ncbi:MAG: DUF2723 domain-containing protein [Bacteroidales bacterium]|nr:DUF2723 domain-containing protein [Bacteroidales bacterium]
MKQYHWTNNIIGWVICIVACTVYILTAEATASWWDCGEYIATAFKLQVGHPPGAPSFQLIGRLFSMFSDPYTAAHAINIMSALCSGFTILFLFWSITLLAKHLLPDPQNPSIKDPRTWGVFAAGIVGALAYTFSDTFWFSAVEGEVYAMSSFFTSVVFWAILKWEEQSDDPRSMRWFLLISLLVGIAIGVHLLNLLTIPAIVYVVYFKKAKKVNFWGFLFSGILSVVLVAVVLWGVIPGIVNLDSAFDVFFVNKIHAHFNTGTVVYFILLAVIIAGVLILTHLRKIKGGQIVNTAVLSFVMLLIGYSTFFILVIRANTNTPLNENAPKDAVALRAYLGREQYGDTPVFKGQFYTAKNPIGADKGYTKYIRGKDEKGRDCYIPAAYAMKYKYDPRHTGLFPRMWSSDTDRKHPQFYEYWAGKVRGNRRPTSAQNFKFMMGYQFNWMYWRYFMWNFAGRQNDIQGHYFNDDGTRDYLNGNWICGIKPIDEARLGPQSNLPDHMKDNKARNRYYMLPLLLGLIGLVYHAMRNRKDAFVVLVMFVMTGLAIAVYLNMPPRQPRERDYAFVGSFSFFAIWIGLGVMALADWISKAAKSEKAYKIVLPVVFVASMAAVPCLMASENWDDHDRSHKYAARDFAKNYLQSVKKNGVLITFGDNDTFPLWYAQEVEGVRTDVRILNYTLSGMHWYVEQLYNKLYESDPLPFTLPKEYYGLGKDMIYLQDNSKGAYLEVTDVLSMVRDHPEKFTVYDRNSDESFIVLPTKRFKITLDKPKLVSLGVLTQEQADIISDTVKWEINRPVLYRYQLMMLDIIGTNRFERDLNIMSPHYIRAEFPLSDKYSVQDGMNYKLLPAPAEVMNVVVVNADDGHPVRFVKSFTDQSADYFINGVKNDDGSYTPLEWGNLNSDIYVDPVSVNSALVQSREFVTLADELSILGDNERARQLIDTYEKAFPSKNFPRDKFSLAFIRIYYKVCGPEKAEELWNEVKDYYMQRYAYLNQYRGTKASGVRGETEECVAVLNDLSRSASAVFKNPAMADELRPILSLYGL